MIVWKKREISTIVWTSILANAMSFFGFVYEEIDFVPNYFTSSPAEAKMSWSEFHSLTTPAYYHILPSIIAIMCVVALWFYKRNLTDNQIRKLKIASLSTLLVNILTGIAVTQINNKLYFGEPIGDSETIKTFATIWGILNFLRLSFVAISTMAFLKFFSINIETVE